MGRVFLGFSPAGRAVAVKIVHPEFARDPEFVQRFRAARYGRHRRSSGAYTAPVVAAEPDDDPPWLATAFVAGPSLAEAVAQAGPFPEAAIWRLAGGLAEALQAVHARGPGAPGPEADQRAAGGRRPQGDRFRDLPGPGRHRADCDQHDDGHPGIHVA